MGMLKKSLIVWACAAGLGLLIMLLYVQVNIEQGEDNSKLWADGLEAYVPSLIFGLVFSLFFPVLHRGYTALVEADTSRRLFRTRKLYDQGLLTKEEFEAQIAALKAAK